MSLNHNISYNRKIRLWLKSNFKYAEYLSKQNLKKRSCPVCNLEDAFFFANNGFLDFVKCKNCQLVYMNPTLDLSSVQKGFEGDDRLLVDYFQIVDEFRTMIFSHKPDPLKDNKLKDIYQFKTSGKLLDIGCSFGDFLQKAKYFYEVEGLEINPNTAANAVKNFCVHNKYLHELISEDKVKFSKRYDVVTMHQILYGVPDPLRLLNDVHTILKDDGILYINTPNADSYAMELFKGKCNHLYDYTSQNIFNKTSLKYLAANSGFSIIFFRSEWLDIYHRDVMELQDNPAEFIHKRNTHLPGYEDSIAIEDECLAKMNINFGTKGNYIIVVLRKC
jgi:SAM-dependent methyltransferase